MTTQRVPAAVDAFYDMISARATAKNRGQEKGRRNAPGTGTLKLRRPIMNALIEYCQERNISHVHMLSGTDIDLIVATRLASIKPMRGEDVPRTTINNQVTGLKSFLSFCLKRRWITGEKWNELAANLAELPDVESPALIVPVDMWPKMFAFAEKRHLVERIYLELGYYLLLRDSEVTRLQFKHINWQTHVIKAYRDKGGDSLEFDCPEELWASLVELREWMEEQHGQMHPDWYLVPARVRIKGQQVKRAMHPGWEVDPFKRTCSTTSYNLIKKSLKAMGYTDEEMFGQASHVMRRSGAAHLFDANPHNINLIRAALGHQSITTTMRYIRRSLQRDELKAALNRPVKRAIVPAQTGRVRVDEATAQATLEAILDVLTPQEQSQVAARLAARQTGKQPQLA